MKKRALLLGVAILLLLLGGYYLFPTQRTQLLGWISGQPFYAGQPASFWIAATNEQPDKVIQQLADGGTNAIPVTLKMLNDKEVAVRRSAVACLDRIGAEKPTVISGLCARISVETDPQILLPAIQTVIKANRDSALEMLAEAISKNLDRKARILGFGYISGLTENDPKIISAIHKATDDDDPLVRLRIAQSIWTVERDITHIMPTLLEIAGSKGNPARGVAIGILWGIGPKAAPATPVLANALEDEDESVRNEASKALWYIRPTDPVVIKPLIFRLDDQNWRVRFQATAILSGIGPEAKEAVPGLVRMLKDESTHTRISAAQGLGRIRATDETVVSALVAALKYDDVRSSIIEALGKIGPGAKNAAPKIAEALKDDSPYLRIYAARSLWQINHADVRGIPALKGCLNDEISSVRVQAAKALWQINPQDSSFVKVLQECLTGDKNSRYAALSALGECPSIAQEFLQPIIEALSDSNADHSVRRTAAEVLGKLGERGKTAVPALLAATKHQEPEMREAARDALKAIDPSIDVRTKSQ